MTTHTRVNEIDLLRFIAAMAVVLYHYTFRGFAADSMTVMPYLWPTPVTKYGSYGVALFFMLTAAVLWIKYALSAEPALAFNSAAVLELCVTGGAMAAGYALWNVGIPNGNLTLLATASYFTPVLSTFFAALWLSTRLTATFWQGVAMVTAGSLVCWAATRGRPARNG